MNRRTFTTSIAVTLAALALPDFKPRAVLYCDGRRDDTAALQAWFDGKPVYRSDGSRVGDVLRGHVFAVSGTLHANRVKHDRRLLVENCYFHGHGFPLPSTKELAAHGISA